MANEFHPSSAFQMEQSVVVSYIDPMMPLPVILSPKTGYEVRVRAMNAWGAGIWSHPVLVVTPDSCELLTRLSLSHSLPHTHTRAS